MKKSIRLELANLALWLIAILTTLYFTGYTGIFTYLGPLYFICAAGSTIIVRKARYRDRSEPMAGN